MRQTIALPVVAILFGGCGDPARDVNDKSSSAAGAAPPKAAVPAVVAPTQTNKIQAVSGTLRQNNYMKAMVTEAGFVDPPGQKAGSGQRFYAVGLRGTSRSRNSVAIDIGKFIYAQNDNGCISKPELDAPWLDHPFSEIAEFSQSQMTDGQLAFQVPDDTKRVRILIASGDEQTLAIPAGRDFTPSWPTPVATIEDGSTMRVMVLPRPDPPPALPPPAEGYDRVVLDYAVENLNATQGIEFQPSQQLRLRDSSGSFIQASSVTSELGCRLTDGDVIPPGHVRRFMVAYDMPSGAPMKLQYRGFELEEANVDLQ